MKAIMKNAMKKWYKPVCVSMCAVILMGGLTACGSKGDTPSKTPNDASSEALGNDTSSGGGTVMMYSSMQEQVR